MPVRIFLYHDPAAAPVIVNAGISDDNAPGGSSALNVMYFGLNDAGQGLKGLDTYRRWKHWHDPSH